MTALGATLLALALAACGGSDDGPGSAAPSAGSTASAAAQPISPCHEDGDTELTATASDGAEVFAVTVGTGMRAVLLSHQYQSKHCEWMPFARQLAAQGVAVYALDLRDGLGSTDAKDADPTAVVNDVLAVAELARERGATEIVAAGASMGASATLIAAQKGRFARAAALSAGLDLYGTDVRTAVRALDVPVLIAAGTGDGSFGDNAQALAKAGSGGQVDLLTVDSSAHGTSLFDDPTVGTQVSERLSTFLLAD